MPDTAVDQAAHEAAQLINDDRNDLAAAITDAPSHVDSITEHVRVLFDPPALLPGGKRLLSINVVTSRFTDGRGSSTVVYGNATSPHGDGSHLVTLPRELAARYLPAVAA